MRDRSGNIIAEETLGPANVHINRTSTLSTIRGLIDLLIEKSNHRFINRSQISLGLGLAGVMTSGDKYRISQEFLDFHSVFVESDAVTACLGAHGSRDGGLVIVGTGSSAVARIDGRNIGIGGRGFLLGDDGSGARIGLEALRQALLAADGLREHTPLSRRLMANFANDPVAATRWSLTAKSNDYAAFAPSVFRSADLGDAVALPIVKEAAKSIDTLIQTLSKMGAKNIALVGGIAAPLSPYLARKSAGHLVVPERDALEGAIMLANGSISLAKSENFDCPDRGVT